MMGWEARVALFLVGVAILFFVWMTNVKGPASTVIACAIYMLGGLAIGALLCLTAALNHLPWK